VGVYTFVNSPLNNLCLFCGSGLDPAAIEANTGIEMPPHAGGIESYAEGFRDVTTYGRFTIPAADLAGFLASTGCREGLMPIDPASMGPPRMVPVWWRPMNAHSLESCTGIEGSIHQTIYLDTSNAESQTVFLFAAVY
jgi:hypothetical protein